MSPATNQREPDISSLLESISPGLSSAVLQETGRQAESLDTVRFAFNPWHAIPNVTLAGYTFGIHHVVFKRMELIPLKVYRNPVIQPRSSGFAVGSVTQGGVFPAGSVGSKVEQRLQFPAESARELVYAYGSESPNNIGMVMLDSLTATQDADKLESALIFRAVMETAFDDKGTRGVDICLERLPEFLNTTAARLLSLAGEEGVTVPIRGKSNRVVPISAAAVLKGNAMLQSLRDSIAAATARALDPSTGILTVSKDEILMAMKGQKDKKIQPDKLDTWLLGQFPSFSLDTDVERATRANASVTEAIRNRGAEDALTLHDLLEMQRATLDQLAKANELNQRLFEQMSPPQPAATPQPPA